MTGPLPQGVRTISPVDGSLYVSRPFHGRADTDAALSRARRASASWRAVPLPVRIDAVRAGLDRLLADGARMATEVSWQMGRPLSQVPGELAGTRDRARHMLDIAGDALRALPGRQGANDRRETRREPLGTVLVVAPWNYPYLTAINTVIPALVAGNSVLLKPSPQTPLAGEHFAAAFSHPDLPEGLLQCLHLAPEQVLDLVGHGDIDAVAFTGSTANGIAVEKAAAGRFLPVGLELGGKDAAYVRRDADIETAAAELASGAFFNAGQSCCAIERVYVHRDVIADFNAAYAVEARKLVPANPLRDGTKLGPVVSLAAAARIREDIEESLAAGARYLFEPAEPADELPANYLAPRVLVDVNHGMRIMQAETFGPVVGIMPVSGDEEAVANINDSVYGLTASLWSADRGSVDALAGQLEVGTVFMNRCDVLDPSLAWAGSRDSGRGCSLSCYGYHALTRPKSLNYRLVNGAGG